MVIGAKLQKKKKNFKTIAFSLCRSSLQQSGGEGGLPDAVFDGCAERYAPREDSVMRLHPAVPHLQENQTGMRSLRCWWFSVLGYQRFTISRFKAYVLCLLFAFTDYAEKV